MKIYLLRHGETDWNKEKRHAYNKDLVLNAEGIEQAKKMAKELETIDYDLVITSPFIRAIQTTEIVNNKECPVIIDKRLEERNVGILDGKKLSETNMDGFYNYYRNIKYEKAEDLQECCKRVWNFLDDIKIKNKDKTVLIVTHNIVIRAIKAYILGIPEDGDMGSYGIKNCEIEEYELY